MQPEALNCYDLVVIGSGPAGIYGALEAAKLGKRVCVIEKHPQALGGAWLHTGTIPSKTFRESLDAIHSIRSQIGAHWVDRLVANMSTSQLQRRADEVTRDEEKLIQELIENAAIEVIRGTATIEDNHLIRINLISGGSRKIESEFILIATGSRPRRPSEIPFDGWRVVDSDEILTLEQLPSSIVVFGAGVIGCEYARIFQALGVETTIVDARSRIMQCHDREIADELMHSMEGSGVKFKLGFHFDKIRFNGPKVVAVFDEELVEADLFFFAAGRESSSQRLGLEKIGVNITQRGAIAVNSHFQSSIPHIYAAGDVIGPPALASTSFEQGRIAVLHAFGSPLKFPDIFPLGIYTIPEMSSVGKTEEELLAQNCDYVVGKAHYSEIARGYIRGDSYGLIKMLVCAKSRCILGIHVVGADAANLIHIGQCCMVAQMPIDQVVNDLIFNHPTLAEGYKIAASKALHALNGLSEKDEKVA